MPLLRYPGSKHKLYERGLRQQFPHWVQRYSAASKARAYFEPFFGSGAVGFHVLRRLHPRCRIWINDLDEDLMCLWRAVKDSQRQLLRRIRDFQPSVDAFQEFKCRDGIDDGDAVERGFRKLALHRMSISGFGATSGGPMGGLHQVNKHFGVASRWNPKSLARQLSLCSGLLNSFHEVTITCGDFEPVVRTADQATFVYCGPPYVTKGSQLYKHSMCESEHRRLSHCLKECCGDWAASYDDCPQVREMYSWASVSAVEACYSNAVCVGNLRPQCTELLIHPPS